MNQPLETSTCLYFEIFLFSGGGMQLIFSSTTVQPVGPNDSKVSFVVADTLEKLQDMGAFCPHTEVVPVQPDDIVVE